MFKRILSDIDSFFTRDPAARSRLEVIICYPGLHALLFHRLSHWLWKHNVKLPARFMSYLSRFITGIEIHPGAVLGEHLFIDHGMGVVIGETATIGNNVTIYHDVTLGGTSLEKGIRHPQLGDDVIIGAGAQLLGPIRIGSGARIGSNAVVIGDVEENTTVVGVPARPVKDKTVCSKAEEHIFAPYGTPAAEDVDPINRAFSQLNSEITSLKQRIDELESGLEKTARNWEAS